MKYQKSDPTTAKIKIPPTLKRNPPKTEIKPLRQCATPQKTRASHRDPMNDCTHQSRPPGAMPPPPRASGPRRRNLQAIQPLLFQFSYYFALQNIYCHPNKYYPLKLLLVDCTVFWLVSFRPRFIMFCYIHYIHSFCLN